MRNCIEYHSIQNADISLWRKNGTGGTILVVVAAAQCYQKDDGHYESQ